MEHSLALGTGHGAPPDSADWAWDMSLGASGEEIHSLPSPMEKESNSVCRTPILTWRCVGTTYKLAY